MSLTSRWRRYWMRGRKREFYVHIFSQAVNWIARSPSLQPFVAWLVDQTKDPWNPRRGKRIEMAHNGPAARTSPSDFPHFLGCTPPPCGRWMRVKKMITIDCLKVNLGDQPLTSALGRIERFAPNKFKVVVVVMDATCYRYCSIFTWSTMNGCVNRHLSVSMSLPLWTECLCGNAFGP